MGSLPRDRPDVGRPVGAQLPPSGPPQLRRHRLRRLDGEKGREVMAYGRVLTCVYCGHQYPQDTPAWGEKVLTDHIRECPKHPLRKAEADVALLRGALVGLVGVDGKDDLEEMEANVRSLPIPEADRTVSLNAIHALLAVTAAAKEADHG